MRTSLLLFIFSVALLIGGIINNAMQTPEIHKIQNCDTFRYWKNNETLVVNNKTIGSVVSVEYTNKTLTYVIAEPIPLLTWVLLSAFLFTFLIAFLVLQKERGE